MEEKKLSTGMRINHKHGSQCDPGCQVSNEEFQQKISELNKKPKGNDYGLDLSALGRDQKAELDRFQEREMSPPSRPTLSIPIGEGFLYNLI